MQFLKCYYWASVRFLSAFAAGIIKELCINGSQQFSALQSHYIYREGMESNKKKINWRHATVRTGA